MTPIRAISRNGHVRARVTFAVLAAFATTTFVEASGPFRNPLRQRTSVEQLAEKIDKLERDLQYSGRITVKAPDVWGQARMTAHREEFERQMAAQLDKFTVTTNAQIAIADQSFLQQAMALSAATQGITPSAAGATGSTATTSTTTTPAAPAATPPLTNTQIGLMNSLLPTPVTTNTGGTVTTTAIVQAAPFGLLGQVGGTGIDSVQLEPEILLDQRKRFLDHLHEIRRINEGDDTADSPGYSLNLVRVPVSILPGDKTRENFGAEVTLSAEAMVTEELLPTTFRELVINDLVDQMSMPIVRILDLRWESFLQAEELRIELDFYGHAVKQLADLEKVLVMLPPGNDVTSVLQDYELSLPVLQSSPRTIAPKKHRAWRDLLHDYADQNNLKAQTSADQQFILPVVQNALADASKRFLVAQKEHSNIVSDVRSQASASIGVQVSRERRARYPVAPSQLKKVFGEHEFQILMGASFAARDRFQARDRVQLSDIQSFLRNELESAYDFLGSTQSHAADDQGNVVEMSIWDSPSMPTASDVRQLGVVSRKRQEFYAGLAPDSRSSEKSPLTHTELNKAQTPTEALAWAILVESALLNQHLNDDLKSVSQDPNCECVAGMVNDPCPFQFYGPNPSPEARQAFVQYVKCRWPIRVFALDPVTQQQNVADSFSLRRETQLAVALGFSKGLVNTQSLTRHMRRVEQDLRTIALNNTHVGFGAGDDTFGWRFFPRVQTPDVESNATTLVRDHILGGPSRDQRHKRWRMEPGMRECVALVVMPSFVKHVRFDVRTDWFQLVPGSLAVAFKNPKTGPTMESTVEWSESIRSIEDAVMMCVKDEHKYRTGEVERLVKRAKQISQQLPLNTMYAQVPYENTLGGFEMFASGVTDLAPELVGFYGSPGVDRERETTLFLVGDNFSVHATKVVAGNQPIETRMLSREVIQVTIPRNVRVDRRLAEPRTVHVPSGNEDAKDVYVEIRLATPYGVSSPLYVPVVEGNGLMAAPVEKKAGPVELYWDRKSYSMSYRPTISATGPVTIDLKNIKSAAPHRFALITPASKPLPKGTYNVTVEVTASHNFPLQPGTILFNSTIANSDAGGPVVLDGTAFQAVHSALKDSILPLLNEMLPTKPWPDSIDVELVATVAGTGDNAIKSQKTPPMLVRIQILK